jgi:SAM-dependent methyltransferase
VSSLTVYDHPLYYDILFDWDRSREADLYHHLLVRSGAAPSEPVLEVACGTGLVARRLARRGWNVTGLDLRPAMLAFLRERAEAEGTRIATLCADMARFDCETRFAAAYNPLSSFRLLRDDASAEAHLRRVAAVLRPGGVYVLDLELLANAAERVHTTDESWEHTRDGVTVRADDDAVRIDDHGARHVLAWGTDGHLRGYTPAAFAERVAAAPQLRIESWHPESTRATGVSEFPLEGVPAPPPSGRALVLLRRV